MVENAGVYYILTSKCASRHSGVAFFYYFSTSERPKVVRACQFFLHFHVQMRFAPQRRAIFPDRNFQNVSDHEVFCTFFTYKCASRHSAVPFLQIATCKMCLGPSVLLTFSLANVLRATAQCHFCRSQLAKCAWDRQFFSTFSLTNVLCATAPCHFCRWQLPKCFRQRGVSYILT